MFGASDIEAMSTKQIQRQVAINTLQAQKIELDKKETASTIALTQADITELATKKGVTDATLLELKSKLGLEATEKGVWASTKMLTEAEVDLTLAELGCDEATKQSIKTKLVENGVMKEQITLAGLLRKALNFVQAHPVVTVLTAIAAVSVAALALNDLLTTSAEEAQETFKEFQEVESEINSLNSELEETKNRIDELNTQKNLSLVEAEELEKLKETNRQLELEIRNKEIIARQKKEESNKSAIDYFDGNNYLLSSGGMGNKVDLMEDQLQRITQLEEELANYSGDVNDGAYTDKKTALDSLKSIVSETLEEFMSVDDGLVEGLDNGLLEQLEELYRYYNTTMNDIAQTNTDTIEGAFEKVEFKGIKDKLIDLENAGKLSADILSSQFAKFTGVLNDAGISAEELYQYIQYLANPDGLDYSVVREQLFASMGVNTRQPGKYAYDAISMFQNRGLLTNEALEAYIAVRTKFAGKTDTWTPEDWAAHIEEELNGIDATINVSFGDIFALEGADGELIKLGTISEEVDKLQTAWSGLREMMDNYNKTGTITVDQFQDLLSYGDEYLQYLVDEKGNLQLNEEALKKVAAAKIENMKAEILRRMISNLDLIVDQATAEDFLKDKINASTLAIADNTEALKENIETKLRDLAATEGITESTMDAITAYVNNTISVMDKLGSSISTSSFSSTTKDFKETFDWVETAISRVQRTITNLGKLASATYRNWSTRNNALAQEMSAVNQEIAIQQNAYDEYMRKANSVNLSDYYKNLVHNGSMDINDITNESLAENIKLYQDYYEKALDASDAVEDLRENLAELAMTNFENISTQYDEQISLIDHYTSMLEGYVSQSEAAGFWASEVYYQKLADTELENINKLQSKYNDLIAQFNENVNNGSIEKYSENWYEMYQNINDVEQALQDANTALVEYNQTLQQIRWDLFDRSSDYKNNLTEEADFLIDLLDNYEQYNKNGSLTEHGLAVQGLHAVNYNVYLEQAASYADEIQKINEEIANDPNDLQLIDRRNELLGLQQQAIQNAMSEKEVIKDLVSEGYDKMLDSLQELINKHKEALNAEKDLYNYQNSIKEKTDTISNYRKQIQSYASDNSEEAKATIQKLQLSLEKAEQDLRETEYDKWLSDQESLLDNLYDQTEVWINGRLDEINGLVSQTIEVTNANASSIKTTIDTVASSLGVTLSEAMDTIWGSEEKALGDIHNVVKEYGDILYGIQGTIDTSITNGTTTVQNALKDIDNDILKMIEILNAEAKVNAESIAQQQEQAEHSQDDNDTYEYTPEPTPAPQPEKITLGGGLFYEDSYKGGKTGNSVSQWTGREVEVTHTSGTGMVHIVDAETGTVLGWVDPDQLKGYATGTTNARRGFNMVSEAGDEIVLDNRGNAVLAKGKQLYPFEGGETVINASETASILRNGLVPLSEQAFLNGLIMKPNYSALQSLQRSSGSVSNDIKMNITLPNVTDYDSFVTQLKSDKRFEKIVQSMTIDRALNKNSLSKNKL